MDTLAELSQIEQAALAELQAAALALTRWNRCAWSTWGARGSSPACCAAWANCRRRSARWWGSAPMKCASGWRRAFDARRAEVEAAEEPRRLEAERLDVTLPGRAPRIGRKHPLTRVLDEIKEICTGLGFEMLEGPEVETFFYNFSSLNYPEDHPAMDEQDSFYLNDDVLLRTHTTAVQVRILQERRPPVRCIYLGRVHRREQVDLRHSHTFHQVDGLLVDEGITFADLKGTLDAIFKELFGRNTQMRFRADFFPFTEPSAEFAFSCFACHGQGCRLCSGSRLDRVRRLRDGASEYPARRGPGPGTLYRLGLRLRRRPRGDVPLRHQYHPPAGRK